MPTRDLIQKGFIFLVAGLAWNAAGGVPAGATTPNAFRPGETITYDIKKFLVTVGEASLVYSGPVELQGRTAMLITFTAKGFQFYDQERIYIDPVSFHPLVIERDLNIFGSDEKIVEYYDATRGKVRIVKTAGGQTTEQILEKGERFENIYGFIYRYRNSGKFQERESTSLHLPTQDVKFELVKNVKINMAKKDYEAYYMRSAPRQYHVWFDASGRRIPLKIIGAMGGANVSMVLSEYKDAVLADIARKE